MSKREVLIQTLVSDYKNQIRKIRACFLPMLKEYIPLNEYAALNELHCHGDLMISEIADHLQVTNSHISVTSDKLINRGLVIRKNSAEDRRIVYLSITPKGEELAVNMDKVLHEFYEEKLSKMTIGEIETFISLIHKINL
ncbi:MarR family transcriptional regulator [Fictibacillus macauensis ZFHKF-1]|uniref:MarR family transcriptional regulator n=1 Tax=Fictibacillus macauensis ZFHKF-1 TaxID=1196324 RepID=I8IZ69_9BACL|nr:MarR family transcriptional regulator [Fictibacillus macauensis]EIT84786.1 MarR family transcriptional regulator [Fictibacillus macauensis ZFHKF-1]